MKALCLLVLAGVCLAAAQTRWNVPSNEGVSVLSDANFPDFISTHKYVMVMFTSPGCPHCKRAHPDYVKLAQKFDEESKDAVIAEVDVTASPALASRYAVSSYPTYKYFFHGHPIDYTHDRSEKHIAAWLANRMRDRAQELKKPESYQKVKDMRLAGVLYLAKKNKRVLTAFQTLAAAHARTPFFYTYLDEVQSDLKITTDAALVVFRKFDDGHKILSNDDLSYDIMSKFFDTVRMPLVPLLSQSEASDVFGPQKTAVLLFAEDETSGAFKDLEKVAASRQFDLRFARVSLNEEMGKNLAELLGVTEAHLGQVRLVKFGETGLEKYRLETVTEKSLIDFIQAFKAGKLSKYLKSAAPVGGHAPGKVWEVTGDEFEQLVLASPSHVLLNVYSHNCEHCHELEPVYEKLADRLKKVPGVVVARFNGHTNEHPALTVHGFPTIKLFKKGRKSEPVTFRGAKTLRNLAEFLERELGSEVRGVVETDDSL